jgi:hypothetical protein
MSVENVSRAAIPLLATVLLGFTPAAAAAAVGGNAPPPARGSEASGSLESAAAKAGSTGRAVAMSLIGLALAVAGTVLVFRRDFKDAAALFAVGIVAVVFATPTGENLLRSTAASLFGGG